MRQHQWPLLLCSQDQEWKARDVALIVVDFTALMLAVQRAWLVLCRGSSGERGG